jgi:hypothetical protein
MTNHRSCAQTGYRVECFGCGNWLPIKLSKKERAYWVCDQCAVQVFLRKTTMDELREEDFAFSVRMEE